MNDILFSTRAFGLPVPQGSMRGYRVGNGVRLTSDNTKLKPWRETVMYAARENKPEEVIAQACTLDVWFYLPRPVSAPKKVQYPTKKPDADKLLRAVCDALTQSQVWSDDSIAVDKHVHKRFATEDEPPGALITIERMP